MCDTKGAIYEGRPLGMNSVKNEVAKFTNIQNQEGSLRMLCKVQMYLLVFPLRVP